jgi:hypothetical protein
VAGGLEGAAVIAEVAGYVLLAVLFLTPTYGRRRR